MSKKFKTEVRQLALELSQGHITEEQHDIELERLFENERMKGMALLSEMSMSDIIQRNPLKPEEIRDAAQNLGLAQSDSETHKIMKSFTQKGYDGLSYVFKKMWNNPIYSFILGIICMIPNTTITDTIALVPLLIAIVHALNYFARNSVKLFFEGAIFGVILNGFIFGIFLLFGGSLLRDSIFGDIFKQIISYLADGKSICFVIQGSFGVIKTVTVKSFSSFFALLTEVSEYTLKVIGNLMLNIFNATVDVFKDTSAGQYMERLRLIVDGWTEFLSTQGITGFVKNKVADVITKTAETIDFVKDEFIPSVKNIWKMFKFASEQLPALSNSTVELPQLPNVAAKVIQGGSMDLTKYQLDNLNFISNKLVIEIAYLYEYLLSIENLSQPIVIPCGDKYIYRNEEVLNYVYGKCQNIGKLYMVQLITYKPEVYKYIIEEVDKKIKLLN
jgi:hypothetical protein